MYALTDQWAERDPWKGTGRMCVNLCAGGKWTRLILLTFSVKA